MNALLDQPCLRFTNLADEAGLPGVSITMKSMSKLKSPKQLQFFSEPRSLRYCHGGSLFQTRAGRKQRPLSCKESLHVVFKANKSVLRSKSFRRNAEFLLVKKIIRKYAGKFFVKIEQISIQHDHIHCLIRTSRRSFFHYFFRVVAGQIAQRFVQEGLLRFEQRTKVSDTPQSRSHKANNLPKSLWKYRPFTRVVRGLRALKIVWDYIQFNELEVLGRIPYASHRLRGLTEYQWKILWSS